MSAFTLTKEAKETIQVFNKASRGFQGNMQRFAQIIAKQILVQVKSRIEKQSYSHKALSAPYLARKIQTGQDSRILIATGEYLRSFQTRTTGAGVEISCDAVKMKFLEFGTKNMSARPHWRPVLAEVRRMPEVKEVLRVVFSR